MYTYTKYIYIFPLLFSRSLQLELCDAKKPKEEKKVSVGWDFLHDPLCATSEWGPIAAVALGMTVFIGPS